jgi:hypothetical protein
MHGTKTNDSSFIYSLLTASVAISRISLGTRRNYYRSSALSLSFSLSHTHTHIVRVNVEFSRRTIDENPALCVMLASIRPEPRGYRLRSLLATLRERVR